MTVSLIIRPSRDVEEYVLWSMVSEAPEFVGDREQLVERLTAEFARLDCPNCRASRQYDLTRRVARADRFGSATAAPVGPIDEAQDVRPPVAEATYGGYDTSVVYEQRGLVATADLGRLTRLLHANGNDPRDPEVQALITPLIDEDAVDESVEVVTVIELVQQPEPELELIAVDEPGDAPLPADDDEPTHVIETHEREDASV